MATVVSFAKTPPLSKTQSFSPATAQAMGAAFDAAWEQLVRAGSVLAAPFRAEHTREALAMRIIDIAQEGQCDVAILQRRAIEYVANLEYRHRA